MPEIFMFAPCQVHPNSCLIFSLNPTSIRLQCNSSSHWILIPIPGPQMPSPRSSTPTYSIEVQNEWMKGKHIQFNLSVNWKLDSLTQINIHSIRNCPRIRRNSSKKPSQRYFHSNHNILMAIKHWWRRKKLWIYFL